MDSINTLKKLGVSLKRARKSLGYTQKELADLAGVRQSTISSIEKTGAGNIETLIKIIQTLNVTISLNLPSVDPIYHDFESNRLSIIDKDLNERIIKSITEPFRESSEQLKNSLYEISNNSWGYYTKPEPPMNPFYNETTSDPNYYKITRDDNDDEEEK